LGLVRDDARLDAPEWSKVIRDLLATEKPSGIVVMLGLNDRLPLRDRIPATKETTTLPDNADVMERGYGRGFDAVAKAELWERWRRGESLKAIGRAFGKPSSSIYFQVAPHGGIRPASRRRSRLALRLAEREEISRGIAGARSMRSMARLLRRARSRSPAQEAATRPPSSYSAFFWPGRG
jgi:hypothetical protein